MRGRGQARRSSAEVRALLLDAARTHFAVHGYTRATTEGLAAAAGVNETLLFRHFRNKANLFAEAVLRPIGTQLESALARWARERRDGDDPDTEFAGLVRAMHGALDGRRGDVVAVLEAQVHSPELGPVLDRVESTVVGRAGEAGADLVVSPQDGGVPPSPLGPDDTRAAVTYVMAAMAFRLGESAGAVPPVGDVLDPAPGAVRSAADAGSRVGGRELGEPQVRRSICECATSAFLEFGYKRTTTRAIAARAGVADSTLFRHFANKAALFQEAVVQPFQVDVEAFTSRWSTGAEARGDADDRLSALLTAMYTFLRGHRRTVLLLLTVDEFDASAEHHAWVLGWCMDLLVELIIAVAASVPGGDGGDRTAGANILAVVVGSAVLDASGGADSTRALAEGLIGLSPPTSS
jgi:AcrR family transcriptional regulator